MPSYFNDFWKAGNKNGTGFKSIGIKFAVSTQIQGEKVILGEVDDYRGAFDVIFGYIEDNGMKNPLTKINFGDEYVKITTDFDGTNFIVEPLFVAK